MNEFTSERLRTFCVVCGPNVYIDEDGCCRTCGADAAGSAVERLDATLRALRRDHSGDGITLEAQAVEVARLRDLITRMAADLADLGEAVREHCDGQWVIRRRDIATRLTALATRFRATLAVDHLTAEADRG